MDDVDQGKEALQNPQEQTSKNDDVPPSPSSSEATETDDEASKDHKCKVLVDFYIAQLEDMEHKTDLYTFWFMDKTEETLKNLNTEYQSRRSQLIQWNEEGRDPRVPKVVDMLHNVYLMTCEHVMKPRKSTRQKNMTEKAKALAIYEEERKMRSSVVVTSKTKKSSVPRKRIAAKGTQKSPPLKVPTPAPKKRGTSQSSVPPKKRKYGGYRSGSKSTPTAVTENVPPKPPVIEEDPKQKDVVLKNGTLKRSVYSRPTSVASMKDQTARNKFQSCAKNIKQLQYCTTFGTPAERKFNRKVQHFMCSYDELVQKPHLNKALPIRPEPVCVFLPPEGFELKSFAKMLRKVATEMENKSGKGYCIAKSEEEYSNLIFGPKLPPSSSKKARPKAVAKTTNQSSVEDM